MPHENRPHVARKAKKARRAGTVDEVRLKLWNALLSVENVLYDDDTDTLTVLKAAHAMTQAASAYARIVEAGELEARLSELESAFASKGGATSNTLRRAA